MDSDPNDPSDPIACTLGVGELGDRLAEWQAILDRARARVTTGDGALRIELDDAVSPIEVTRLAAAEQRCCAFFSFAITIDSRGIALEVRAPTAAAEVVAALFGTPSVE